MKNKILDFVFFDGTNIDLLKRRIKHTSNHVDQTIILFPSKTYEGLDRDIMSIDSCIDVNIRSLLINNNPDGSYNEWVSSIMEQGFNTIVEELFLNFTDIFIFSLYNEFPNLTENILGMLGRGPLILRMDWSVENAPLKSKDKWIGSIIFNRSHHTVTNKIIKILQSTKNDMFSFRYNIIDNGYFLESNSEETVTNFTTTDHRGIKLKHRLEVSEIESSSEIKKLRPKKIIDCFIFNNEIDLLKKRINLLNGVVDHFVLVEANQTHSGLSKETYFESVKSDFFEVLHKIEHIVVDLPNQFLYDATESDVEEHLKINWFRENYHRNEILRGLYNLDLIDYDVILISDLDEIPDPSKLNKFIESIPDGEFRVQTQKWYCWDLNRLYNNSWPGTSAIKWDDLKKTTPQTIRSKRYDDQYKNNTELFGWHCSWFGGIDQTMSKLSSFAHQELKDITIEDIENKMTMNLDIHGQVLLDNNDGYDPEFI